MFLHAVLRLRAVVLRAVPSLCVMLATAVLPGLAAADEGWSNRDYEFATRQFNAFADRFRTSLVEPVARGVREKRSGTARPASKEAAALTSAPAHEPKVPAQLAAPYPADKRAAIEQYFGQLLDGYMQVESGLGLPRNDLPGALASFIAGSYMAYTNVAFPDEHFKPLLAQMRGILSADAEFAKASAADKQEMFEHLAILGMLMVTTQMSLQKKPDARRRATMRDAAQDYLERMLNADVDRLEIGAQGLSIRPRMR